MQLKQKHIQSFKEIWKKSFGEEISDEVAIQEALPLLELVSLVSKQLPDELEKVSEDANEQLSLLI